MICRANFILPIEKQLFYWKLSNMFLFGVLNDLQLHVFKKSQTFQEMISTSTVWYPVPGSCITDLCCRIFWSTKHHMWCWSTIPINGTACGLGIGWRIYISNVILKSVYWRDSGCWEVKFRLELSTWSLMSLSMMWKCCRATAWTIIQKLPYES